MNRIFILSLALCAFFSASLYAQYNIVVQNQNASAYKTIDEAYAAANPGDTIYLPGGSFNLPATIDKNITWLGVGYHPDSTLATYFTRINNPVLVSGLADSTCFVGIHFSSNLSFGSNGNDAVEVKLIRCRITGYLTLKHADGGERNINMLISECIFDSYLDANLGANIIVEKSIIRLYFNEFRSSFFDRNIVLRGDRSGGLGVSYAFTNVHNSFITNCIINYTSYTTWRLDALNSKNNNMQYNVLAGNIAFPDGTNSGSYNLTSVDLSTVFENVDVSLETFSYAHNFKMKTGSPAIGAGQGGTDAGIFGGSIPFKEGGLPANPHIKSIHIAPSTNNGMLQIEIEATAQDN